MRSNKEIKIRISTVILMFIILILIGVIIYMYYNFKSENNKIISNKNIETKRITTNSSNIEKNKSENDETDNFDDKTEEVVLNGKKHILSYRNNKTITEILFDGNKIKTLNDSPDVITAHVLKDYQGQYLVIHFINTTMTADYNYFCFINDKGEIIGCISPYLNGTDLSYKQKKLSFEIIDNDKMYIYEPAENYNGAVKYEVNIENDCICLQPIDRYPKEDVVFAGAKR